MSCAFLLTAVPAPAAAGSGVEFLAALATSVGRVHPIIVHFPVALVLAAGGVEAWRAVQRQHALSRFTPVALGLGAAAAVVACITGWLFAADEGGGSDLFWHRWLGILAAALLLPATWVAVRAVRPGDVMGAQLVPLVRAVLFGTALLVGWVGHLGGDMVWGEDYVIKPLQRWAAGDAPQGEPARAAQAGAAQASTAQSGATQPGAAQPPLAPAVFAIFNERCVECHNDERHKGGLSMQDPAQLFVQNDHEEWIVKRGDPEASLLLTRILLPADDDEAMPPKGDRLTNEQVQLIRRWIEAGAPLPAEGATVPPSSPSSLSPSSPSPSSSPPPPPPPPALPLPQVPALSAAAERALDALRHAGVRAQPVAEGSAALEVSAASLGSDFGDAQLALLVPLAPYVVELTLARTSVTDAGLASLPPMPALVSLRVDGTGAADAFAAQLPQNMPALRSLNLVGTPATDKALQAAAQLPGLQRLFVWHTKVTSDGLKALRVARPALIIETGSP